MSKAVKAHKFQYQTAWIPTPPQCARGCFICLPKSVFTPTMEIRPLPCGMGARMTDDICEAPSTVCTQKVQWSSGRLPCVLILLSFQEHGGMALSSSVWNRPQPCACVVQGSLKSQWDIHSLPTTRGSWKHGNDTTVILGHDVAMVSRKSCRPTMWHFTMSKKRVVVFKPLRSGSTFVTIATRRIISSQWILAHVILFLLFQNATLERKVGMPEKSEILTEVSKNWSHSSCTSLHSHQPWIRAISFLGTYPQNLKTFILKDICTPMFTAALFTGAQTSKHLKCPSIDDWIQKTRYIYTMEHYSALRKDEILPFGTTWMELENIMLNDISQKKLRTTWFHSYVGYKTETHRHRHQFGGYQREGGRSMEGYRGTNIWGWKMVWLWVEGAQSNMQIMYHRNAHLHVCNPVN